MRVVTIAICAAVLFSFGCKNKSPEALCDHMIELVKKEDAEKAKKWEADKAECVKEFEGFKTEMGDKYDGWATCVLDASDFKASRKGCDPDNYMKKEEKK